MVGFATLFLSLAPSSFTSLYAILIASGLMLTSLSAMLAVPPGPVDDLLVPTAWDVILEADKPPPLDVIKMNGRACGPDDLVLIGSTTGRQWPRFDEHGRLRPQLSVRSLTDGSRTVDGLDIRIDPGDFKPGAAYSPLVVWSSPRGLVGSIIENHPRQILMNPRD